MNAKTLIKILIFSLWFLGVTNCKNLVRSSVDQASEDYNLLAFLNSKILNGFYWDGLMEIGQCSSGTNNLTSCIVYQENYQNFINLRNKNLFVFADSLQKNGKLTIEIANPDTFLGLMVEIPVLADITTGPETGNGYARILVLSNPTPITKDGITITLNEFTADVLEDGLRGRLNIKLQGTNDTLNLTFSFRIQKNY